MFKNQSRFRHKEWDHRYHVVGEDGGLCLLYEQKPGIVQRVGREHLAATVKQFTSKMPQEFWVTGDEAERIAKSIIFDAEKLAEVPPAIKMKSEPGLAFHRLPFDVGESGVFSIPVFEELLSRTSNPEGLCAFIGSLFVPESNRQQYLWIYGEGENGKSSLLRFLNNLLGPAYHADEVEMSRDKYWTSSFIGRRLVAFPDCNSPCFPRSAKFKGLTGSDAIRIEGKYDKAFSAKLDCKFVFLSNEELSVSGEKADVRRAIYVKIAPIKCAPDPRYDEKLMAEAPNIIATCLEIYRQLCPNNEQIPVKNQDEISELVDEQTEGFLLDVFDFAPGGQCKRYEFNEVLRKNGIKNPREVARIKRFIFQKMRVENKHMVKADGTREKVYVNIKTRENVLYHNFRERMGWKDEPSTDRVLKDNPEHR